MPRKARASAPNTRKPAGRRRPAPLRTAQPATPQAATPRVIYALSDSTGNLARHMLTALLTQFPTDAFSVHMKTFLQGDARVQQAMDEIEREPGIVFHAMVSLQGKQLIADRCRRMGVACCDLTGQFVDFIACETGIQPKADPQRLHRVNEAYQHRIRALEYTLEHDDGLGLDTLHEADIVLAGVSRTSKTPTSVYLAQLGYRVANVSLALGVDPPRQLLQLPPRKVIGLVIDPAQLVEIRSRRQHEWNMAATPYNDPDHVDRELAWSRRLFQHQGWPILNVTDQAVEETAGKILHTLGMPRTAALGMR